jgi:hypothetical protein
MTAKTIKRVGNPAARPTPRPILAESESPLLPLEVSTALVGLADGEGLLVVWGEGDEEGEARDDGDGVGDVPGEAELEGEEAGDVEGDEAMDGEAAGDDDG